MATLGKIMVIVFTALSLAVLTWAFGVYTQRIEFSAGKESPGIFAGQKAKATELSGNADRAFVRWSANVATVNNLEGERYPRRSFYANQLRLARTAKWINPATGQEEPSATPVQVLTYTPNGYIDIRQHNGRPQIMARDGDPLDSIVGYEAKFVQLADEIVKAQKANEVAIAERKTLNDEIVGIFEPKLIKGLRALISEQKTIEEQANLEDVFAADVATNREAEFGLLKKRRDAMTARMDELDRDPERKIVPPGKKGPNN